MPPAGALAMKRWIGSVIRSTTVVPVAAEALTARGMKDSDRRA
jgi:hypothetical protein